MDAKADALFKKLGRSHPTPQKVQALLRRLSYNREEKGETVRSALQAWKSGKCHCLEAAFIAAAILERNDYPPLVLSLESQDGLDHVLYIFKARTGWGSIGRSRDEGLHGREPRYRSLRDLVWTYVAPFVDHTGRITGYGPANLDDSASDWRDSPRNVWKAERYLIELPHKPLHSSDRRYHRLLSHYRRAGFHARQTHWW